MQIKLKRLHPNARLPEFAHPGEDACADLYCVEDVVLTQGVPTMVSLGFSMEVPPGWEAQIRPRSGLAAKHGIQVVNAPGTIDSGYRGTVAVILLWGGYQLDHLELPAHSRVAQMAIRQAPAVEFQWAEELADSARQGGGFGSTGVTNG